MELRDYLAAVRDGWKIVAAFVVLAIVGAVLYAFVLPTTYSSSTSLYVATRVDGQDSGRNIEELSQRSAIAQQRVLSYAAVLNGNVLAEEVMREVGFEFEREQVSASLLPSTVVIRVVALDRDPERAKQIAGKYADLAPGVIRALEDSDDGGWEVEAEVIDDADLGEPEPNRSPVVIFPVAVVLGFGAGIGAATLWWVVRRENQRARSAAEQ